MSTSEAARGYRRAKGLAPVSCNGIQGRLIDISRDGIAFSVKTHFDYFVHGKLCQLSLKIPRSEANPEGVDMDIPGIIRHARMDESQKRLVVGVHLEDLPEESQELINRIILFFAQNFAPLQSMDDFFSTPSEEVSLHSEKENLTALKNQELRQFYRELFGEFDPLPPAIQKAVERHMKEIKKVLNTQNMDT